MAHDLSEFLVTFFEESFEGLDVMENGLLNLDVGAADAELINQIFRAAHSIKGGSATFGLGEVAAFTHLMETLLDELREGARQVTQEMVDALLAAVDVLREMLSANKFHRPFDGERVAAQEKRLKAILAGGHAAPAVPAAAPAAAIPVAAMAAVAPVAPVVDETAAPAGGWHIAFRPHSHLYLTGNDPVRIFRELAELGDYRVEADLARLPDFADLDPESSYLAWGVELRGSVARGAVEDVFAWVEGDCDLDIEPLAAPAERLPAPPADLPAEGAPEPREEPAAVVPLAPRRGREQERPRAAVDSGSIRVNIEKIDAIINLVGELVITQSMLSTLGESFDMNRIQKLRDGLVQLERNTRELQEEVMRMRMLPISAVFHRFPRMVHDLSTQLGKQVELEMSGENTELDKTLVEKIGDPLVHLVRNALDHGIESPEERLAAGKPPVGRVHLNAYHKSGNIIVEVRDDGRGLNPEKLFAKAVERGLVSPDAQLSREQIYEFLFMPGFSTAEKVSDVSGRGVGMDVVRRNVQSVNGSVEIASQQQKGSIFTVRLPLTLAILDGQTVLVGEETYIVPLVSISESIQVKRGMVSHVASKGEAFRWRGDYLPIIRLADIFGIRSRARELSEGLLVVVEGEGRYVGLFVDDLLGQQQVVIKSMEVNYKKVHGISGATILGDGSVALILDVPSLVRMAAGGGHEREFQRSVNY